MFKLKLINKPVLLKLKCNFSFPPIILAKMQEKEIIPTKEMQEILPDIKFDGLSKVIVDKIPDEYIAPSGDLEISQNGTYNVTDKVNAIVNVPEKKLGIKTITINGTYKALDDNLDGYSEVTVATSGVDINDYFADSITAGDNEYISGWIKSVKKLPAFKFNGTSCSLMFRNFKGVSLDLSSVNISEVTQMPNMFSGCSSLTGLDLSKFNTTKVRNMNSMFTGCSSLTSLDLSSFNTSSLEGVQSMFSNCSSLTELDLSSFNTLKVKDMSWMFYNCKSLTNLDLSNFNTSNVTNMSNMFRDCSSLQNLNISNFDFTKVTLYDYMFRNVPTNCYILVKDATSKEWITSKFSTLSNVHYVGEDEG